MATKTRSEQLKDNLAHRLEELRIQCDRALTHMANEDTVPSLDRGPDSVMGYADAVALTWARYVEAERAEREARRGR